MASIKFSRKEFEKHFKLNEELKEKISLFGTHLENVTDEEVELEILPNRPDLFSLQGFIRSFSCFLGKKKGLKEYKIEKPEKNFVVTISKNLEKIRPYTACAIIKDLKFDDEKIKEIIDIQEKIHTTLGRNRKKIAIGIYPLEKITLPISFSAEKPQDIKFIPLEFPRELNALQILQQHPTGREYAHLLEGKDKYPVFRDAKKEVLSLPPIINSHKTGKITETTRDIFIECSGFDLEILKKALNILSVMFAEFGGRVYQMKLEYEGKKSILTPDLTPEKIRLNPENVTKLLGLDLKETEIKALLEKMEYNYDLKSNTAEIPAWRTDFMHEVDLIEDIAIAYGYDKIIPEIPQIATTGQISKQEEIKKKIADILTGLGLLEISSYYLLTDEEAKRAIVKPEIQVEDSKSEYKHLRKNLLDSCLRILSKNVDSEYPQEIFEQGRVFTIDSENKEETGIKEIEMLAIAIAKPETNFTEAKQKVDYLLRMLNLDYTLEAATSPLFLEGRCAKVKVNERELGFIGEISPNILENLKIKMPVSAIQLNLERIFEIL